MKNLTAKQKAEATYAKDGKKAIYECEEAIIDLSKYPSFNYCQIVFLLRVLKYLQRIDKNPKF
jgi:hypothetical protein